MNKIQRTLNQYYEDVGIAPITNIPVMPNNLDAIFADFRCLNKESCRDACQSASQGNVHFLARTEGVTISPYYKKRGIIYNVARGNYITPGHRLCLKFIRYSMTF